MTYFAAAIRGETWKPIMPRVTRRRTQFAEIPMPQRPPPRVTADPRITGITGMHRMSNHRNTLKQAPEI